MGKYIGILTSGGDSPGLNAAIRGVGKAAILKHGMEIIGFRDGFRGIMENRTTPLDAKMLSGILTIGGTILGTSRHKPHKMPVGGKIMDMTDVIVENYNRHHLDALVCLGGGGTQKNAFHLAKQGINVITLPKTIDNDVAMTDVTFGFDTALGIAVDALDRLHSTAISHNRIILVEIMGHNAGWLALGAGISGGADVILTPEIPYDVEAIAESILRRKKEGKMFSIVAVAEGAISKDMHSVKMSALNKIATAQTKKDKLAAKEELEVVESLRSGQTLRLATKLEHLTQIETRTTILGHLQRGGTPSAADRLLSTRLGTACANFIAEERFGVMVAAKGEHAVAVPLEDVVGKRKTVPIDHPWIIAARDLNICLGTDC